MHLYQYPSLLRPPTTPMSESSRASVEPLPPSESISPHSIGSKPPSLPSLSSYGSSIREGHHPQHMHPHPLPHSPHHFPPHLEGSPFAGMFLPRVLMDRSLPCPPDRMFPGSLNPMLVREMIHNEHHFHMHPPMPQNHHHHPRLPPPPQPPTSSSSGRGSLSPHMPSGSQSSDSNAGLSGIDIYSRKLQELATGNPPSQLPLPPPPPQRSMSPKKHRQFHYPMFHHQSRGFKPPFPPKGKACEFCGKAFKFQSNLIVHRRSHTGEKPYKCHLCDHACSQASKLKRHMKTHKKIAPSTTAPPLTSTGSESPSSDTQDDGSASHILKSVARYITDNKSSGGNTSDEDEVEGDLEEEEAAERASMEREDRERERQIELEQERAQERRERESNGDMESNSELDTPVDEEAPLGFSTRSEENKEEKEDDEPTSLLSEVMKNTGLGEIQQYSEAFRQAMAESRERNNSFSGSQRSPQSTEDGSDKEISHDDERRERSSPSLSQHSPSIGQHSPSIEHRSPGLGQRSPNGIHLDRHPSTSPPSLHSSMEMTPYQARMQEVEKSLRPSHHIESTKSAMLELEQVAKRIKVEPTSPSSWVQTATENAAALPRPRDPYMFSQTSEASATGNATNGNLSSYYGHGRHHPHHHHRKHHLDMDGPGTMLPGLPRYHHHHHSSSLPMHKSPKHLTGNRNDQCEYCGKIFKNCSNLTVHRRSHTGEKPYKCNLCAYACAQSSKLTRHMKTHGQGAKEVFKCEVCGMPFSVYSTLEKHMKKSHWGAIKGTAPKAEAINAGAYPTPRRSSPNNVNPFATSLLSPRLSPGLSPGPGVPVKYDNVHMLDKNGLGGGLSPGLGGGLSPGLSPAGLSPN